MTIENLGCLVEIMAFGKTMSGDLVFPAVSEEQFAQMLAAGLTRNAESLAQLTSETDQAISFRGEISRSVVDAGDPLQAGWTFLIADSDPRAADIIKTLTPLAQHRGMKDPSAPLRFSGQAETDWIGWLQTQMFADSAAAETFPQYILMVGGPDQLPFRLQSLLDTGANVGRLDFDDLADLASYVDKIIRLETAPDPVVGQEVVFFAPDAGPKDATHFSREYMVDPLAEYVGQQIGFGTTVLTGFDATKAKLVTTLRGSSPALVYTASHGLVNPDKPLELQMRYNGAICCQSAGPLTFDDLFTGDDVPGPTEPFLEGSVFFQFACFGYGTPAHSDYARWVPDVPAQYADKDFVAALPKRLLAHPRGPIAFIGHLDTAFLHGFDDPQEPRIADRWHSRMQPFVDAVTSLLRVQPSGLAMEEMNKLFSYYNAVLTSTENDQKRGEVSWTPQTYAKLIDRWITRGDAQNYMVFGDPAARLRISAPDASN